MKILARDVQVGQRARLGELEGEVTEKHVNGFSIGMYFTPYGTADAIGIELIEPLVIRAVVVIPDFGTTNYSIVGSGQLGALLDRYNAQPGDTFDIVLTRREAAVAEGDK